MNSQYSASKYSVTSNVAGEQPKLRSPKRKQYKPYPTRPPFLISILCAFLACIALIELVLHKGTKDTESNTRHKARSENLGHRQDAGSASLCTEYATQTVTLTTTLYSSDGVLRRAVGKRRRQETVVTATPTVDGSADSSAAATLSSLVTSITTTATAYGSLDTDTTCGSTTTLSTTVTVFATSYGSLTSQPYTSDFGSLASTTTPYTSTAYVSTYIGAYGSLTSTTSSFYTATTSSTTSGAYPSLAVPSTTTTTTSAAYPTLSVPPPTTTTTAYPSLTETTTNTAYPSLTDTPLATTANPSVTEAATNTAYPSVTELSSATTAYPSLTPSTTALAYSSITPDTSTKHATTPETSSSFLPPVVFSTSYPSLTSQSLTSSPTVLYGTAASAFPSLQSEPPTSLYPTTTWNTLTTISLSGTIVVIPASLFATSASTSGSGIITHIVYSTSYVVSTSTSIPASLAGNTSASTTSKSASATNAADNSLTQSETQLDGQFVNIDYFLAVYLPTILAVMLKSIWVVVFASTKMMEPFHQLSKAKGATAEDSLFADYLATGFSVNSVKAIFQAHFVMALTTSVYVILAFIPPLASESMTVDFLGKCSRPGVVGSFACGPAWMIDISVIRGTEALLGVLAAMVLVLIILQWNRKNGVMSDPSSIASMASYLHHPEVLADFRAIDPMANDDELYTLLAGNQYMLATYEINPGQYRYGLVKTVGTVRIGGSGANSHTRYQPLSNPSNYQTQKPTRRIPWGAIRDGMLFLCLLGLLGISIGYYLDGKSDPFNDYFNSGSFGPRFILVIVATFVDYQWKRIEREVRITDPFRRLAKRMAAPRKTILASRWGTPFDAFPIALWNMNFFVAAIAAVAILSDILILSILGVPYSNSEIKPASLASFYTSFGILGIMLIAFVAVIIWRRSNPPFPRQPDTLASVWTYLCASNMLEDFEGMEFMAEKARNKSVMHAGRRYFYGMANGSDGKDRYMVDHEGAGGTVFY